MNIEYSNLIDRVRLTGNYIDQLARIESQMDSNVENNALDIRVQKLLSDCIDEINKIYIDTSEIISADVDCAVNEKITIAYMQEQCDKKDEENDEPKKKSK